MHDIAHSRQKIRMENFLSLFDFSVTFSMIYGTLIQSALKTRIEYQNGGKSQNMSKKKGERPEIIQQGI